MNPGDKIPKLLAPEPIGELRPGREAWRGWRIIAELAAATAVLSGTVPCLQRLERQRPVHMNAALLTSTAMSEARVRR